MKELAELVEKLQKAVSSHEKIEVLDRFPSVQNFLRESNSVKTFLVGASPEAQVVIKSMIAVGQGERIFASGEGKGRFANQMPELLDQLLPIEKFYSEIGGIAGYHLRMLQLLLQEPHLESAARQYLPPEGVDISAETPEVLQAIADGIRHLPFMAEIYPLGGAADRLRLQDEKTGVALPAARLPFMGKTLLEGMIADLQAREYVYYKLFGEQITTPVAMMTSREKENHHHILAICEESNWFGRSKEAFRFFCQPSVPTINKQGQWCLQDSMKLLLKPGGHGVIWRLARDAGVFDWFFSLGRKKALIRQINNPIAGVDYGIVAFTGIGCALNRDFGFASCPRLVKASEGINVIIETAQNGVYTYALTNIEYCDFQKFGIIDEPRNENYSKFPSNTNILFVDLKKILEAVSKCPIPGILVNLKKLTYRCEAGHRKEEEIARLESTMQNIADFFTESFSERLHAGERGRLKTYLTYNERGKTISTAKREFALGASLLETPEGCFLDVLKNGRDLLLRCGFEVPNIHPPAVFFAQGPSFIFRYHPALGPFYSLIAQKIRGGKLHEGSEIHLEIAEVDIENLDVKGSLLIHAEAVMGRYDGKGILHYSEKCGRCVLKNVKIENRGIDLEMPNTYWRSEIARLETCHIILRGNSEFYAENVTLPGDQFIEVPDGMRIKAREENGSLLFEQELIDQPQWSWAYVFGSRGEIALLKKRARS